MQIVNSYGAGEMKPNLFDRIGDATEGLGIGRPVVDDLTEHPGRNNNWSAATEKGDKILIKELVGAPEELPGRFSRIVSGERLLDVHTFTELRRPSLLAWDEASHALIFDWIDGSKSGLEVADEYAFSDATASVVGTMLGELHRITPDRDSGVETQPHPLPPVGFLDALPEWSLNRSTGGELQWWSLLQRDTRVKNALLELRRSESEFQDTLIHGDLRLDQLLITGDETFLIDWEEMRVGDPARDVGAFAGEWLYFSMSRLPRIASNSDFAEQGLNHEKIVEYGSKALQEFRERTAAFWKSYSAARAGHPVDADLPRRAVGFAGWHMFDRGLAAAHRSPRISAIDRACAGVGRTALLDPEGFIDVIGLGGMK